MEILVEFEGEQLNDIEHHSTNFSSFNHIAQHLQNAKKHQISIEKSMSIGTIFLLIIILIIVLGVL